MRKDAINKKLEKITAAQAGDLILNYQYNRATLAEKKLFLRGRKKGMWE